MTKIVFYEKSGCAEAPRQKILLAKAGYDIETRDLMTEHWTPAGLRGYFANRPVEEWFDPEATQVRSGAINPASASPQAALVAMMVDPDLIKSPLLKLNGRFASGLDAVELQDFIDGKTPISSGRGHEVWQTD